MGRVQIIEKDLSGVAVDTDNTIKYFNYKMNSIFLNHFRYQTDNKKKITILIENVDN